MKRSLFTAVAALLLSGTLLAGGIVTNTNQSAMYTRMAARQATLDIDAVYFNQRQFLGILGSSVALCLVNGNHEQAARYLLNGTENNPACFEAPVK